MEGARPATTADLPRLAELFDGARRELAPLRGGERFLGREARPDAKSLAADLEDPDTLVLAGTIEDQVVGYAVGAVEAVHDGRHLGVVRDLYVEPAGREVGVGEALLGRLLQHFDSRACVGVDAYALPGMRETKNFFEANGFTARLLVVHRAAAPRATMEE